MDNKVDLSEGYYYEIKGISPYSSESKELERKYWEWKSHYPDYDFYEFAEFNNIPIEGLGEYESPREILIFDVENEHFCDLNVMDII